MQDSRCGAKSTMQSMPDVLGRWHRLLHVRAFRESTSSPCWISSLSQTFTSGKAGHTDTGTGRKKVIKNTTRKINFKRSVERNENTRTFTIDLSVICGSERL